jgi:uroporphyrinogen decarboxylase
MIMWHETMTGAERMEALWKGERPDRVPVWPFLNGHAALVCGEPMARMWDSAEQNFRCQRLAADMYGFDGLVLYVYAAFGVWEFGGEIDFPHKKYQGAPFVTRRPVEAEDDVHLLRVPEDLASAGSMPIALDVARRQAERGMRVTMHLPGPLSTAGELVDAGRLMTWLVKKPELVHKVMEQTAAFDIKIAELYAKEFGAENLMAFLGEPTASNMLISPKQFETFVLPYLQKIFTRVLELGVGPSIVHVCGEQNKNLKFWQQVPMTSRTIVSIGREVELATAMELFPNQIIGGNVDPTLIQEGKAEEVLAQARECVETAKYHKGGFVLMAGCDLPPEAPPVNAAQFTKAAREHGRY